MPIGDAGADVKNFAGNFTARSSWKGRGNRQGSLLEPEVKTVQAAGADPKKDFAGGGHGIWNIMADQAPRRAVGEELNSFHGG